MHVRICARRTVHKLLLFQRDRKALRAALDMQRENMEARTTVVALNRKRARLVLHREVVTNRTGTVADKIECRGEAAAREQVMKEIVQCFLRGA